MIESVLSLQITLFSLVALGFLLKRIRLIGAEGQKNLTDLVIYVILPCNILNAFCSGSGKDAIQSYLAIFLMAVVIQIVSLLYGKLMFRRQPEGKRKCLEYAMLTNNAGIIGNPVVEGIFGADGLALASVYLIPIRVMMWSSGLAVFSGVSDRKATVRRVVTHPCIIACALGMVLMLTGIPLPKVISAPIQTIGKCNTAMSMMVIGMILERIDLKQFWDKTVMLFCLHRLILMPALFLLLFFWLPVEPTVLKVSVLLTSMPAAATTSILAEKYQMEPEFGTKMVIASTLLSLPTIFIWSLILI